MFLFSIPWPWDLMVDRALLLLVGTTALAGGYNRGLESWAWTAVSGLLSAVLWTRL